MSEAAANCDEEFTAREAPPPVLCLGETMVLLTADEGSLAMNSHLRLHVGGAESNVASGIAHLGHEVEWFSRLGDDPFGRIVLEFLSRRGVWTANVELDPVRPTGVFFKDRDVGGSHVYYYRSGSAASAMSSDHAASLSLASRRMCHVSGVTAALSSTTDELLQRIVVERDAIGALISFDINYRPSLWPKSVAANRLLELARASDIVMVGRDEAQALWGTETVGDVRMLLPDVPQLVVKDAGFEAVHFGGNRVTRQLAIQAEVVEPVGAGDAFAAGFLSGLLHQYPVARALRLGHIMAALTLQHVSDQPLMPARDDILAVSALDGRDWTALRVRPPHLQNLRSLFSKGAANVR